MTDPRACELAGRISWKREVKIGHADSFANVIAIVLTMAFPSKDIQEWKVKTQKSSTG